MFQHRLEVRQTKTESISLLAPSWIRRTVLQWGTGPPTVVTTGGSISVSAFTLFIELQNFLQPPRSADSAPYLFRWTQAVFFWSAAACCRFDRTELPPRQLAAVRSPQPGQFHRDLLPRDTEFTAPASWREAFAKNKAVASYRTPQDLASPPVSSGPTHG